MSVELPPPGYPMVTRVISGPLFPGKGAAANEPFVWVAGMAHPLVAGMTVVRMFVDENGVDVYSHDGRGGLRHRIPIATVRLVEEAMPLEQLADEIADAESDDDDEPDDLPDDLPDDEPEPEPEEGPQLSVVSPVPPGAVPNGQATS